MNTESKSFIFNKLNLAKAKEIIKKYPPGRQKSATLPLLDLAQRQNGGWLSVPAIEYVANYTSQGYMRVYEVVKYYSMFYTKPVGKCHIQVCGTTPCWLRGAEYTVKSFEKHTNTKLGQTSKDGLFSISEVECLGACTDAPLAQINDDYYTNLDDKKIKNIVEEFKQSESIKLGKND